MSNRFGQAVDFELLHEGGYIWDEHDPGGETNYGISKRAHPDLDIAALTVDQAAVIYRDSYWIPTKGPELPDSLALFTFDAGVQHGNNRARRLLQKAAMVTADGIIGPLTMEAINNGNTRHILQEFAALRMQYYGDLRQFDRYGLGWSRRMMACYSLAFTWL